jgi:hypothetical protein
MQIGLPTLRTLMSRIRRRLRQRAELRLIKSASAFEARGATWFENLDVLDVADIHIEVISEPLKLSGGDNVIFVTHLSKPAFKEHVAHYLKSLKAAGMNVVLVIALDDPNMRIEGLDADLYDGLVLRQNHGYDFSAWAHILKILAGALGI